MINCSKIETISQPKLTEVKIEKCKSININDLKMKTNAINLKDALKDKK